MLSLSLSLSLPLEAQANGPLSECSRFLVQFLGEISRILRGPQRDTDSSSIFQIFARARLSRPRDSNKFTRLSVSPLVRERAIYLGTLAPFSKLTSHDHLGECVRIKSETTPPRGEVKILRWLAEIQTRHLRDSKFFF